MEKEDAVGGIHPVVPWLAPAASGGDLYGEFCPEFLYLPMRQGVGKSATPVVKAGDRVERYSMVGEAREEPGAHVHSGVSGTVTAVIEAKEGGGGSTTVVVRNDGKGSEVPLRPAAAEDREAVVDAVRRAGIIGMGGAGFPTHIKLAPKGRVDCCIINGAECEPLLLADDTLMRTHAEGIAEGARLIRRALGCERVVVAIEGNKPAAIDAMRAACRGKEAMEVRVLPHRYPMGGEKQVIRFVTGREVPEGKLPADVGAVVINVGTALALERAVHTGLPLTHRLCTVAGDVARPGTVLIPVGTRAGDLLAFCGGARGRPGKILLGGPMMGRAIGSLEEPLLKTTNGLIVFNETRASVPPERPCIRCNRCSRVCPVRLMPQFIDGARRRERWDECRRLHPASCINCGCCSYVCPSKIPLAANITSAAKALRERKTQ